jgi:hypothetical protein
VVKKRRGRAQQIGMGAQPTMTMTTTTLPDPPRVSVVSDPVAIALAPSAAVTLEESPTSARDAAAEAARRAEEFMRQKSIEQAREEQHQHQQQQRHRLPSYGSSSQDSDDGRDIQPTASTDSVIAAAQKAAVEAQSHIAAQQKSNRFMGGLFKGFGATPTTSSSNSSNNTLGVSTSTSIGRSSPPTAMTSSLPPPAPMPDVSPALLESKHRLPKQPYSMDSNPRTDATSSTTTGGFQPPAPTPSAVPVSFSPARPPVRRVPPTTTTTTTATSLPSALPPPKQHKTPTDLLNDLLTRLSTTVQRSMDQVALVRAQRKMLLEERYVAIAKLRLSTQQISQAEVQLQAAAKDEDYELADQLGQVIQAHDREKSEVSALLDAVTMKLSELESQKNDVIGSVAGCFETLHAELLQLKEAETTQETRDDTEAMKQFSSISKQLSAEQERLQQDLKHLERDEQLVADERTELETSISEHSGVFERQRDDAKAHLSQLELEMEELRKLLQHKQDESARLRTELYGLDDSISKVRVKFSRQLTRVTKKEASLKENRREWELEQATYDRQTKAHENQVQTHSQALMQREEFSKWINAELALAQEWTTLVQSQLDFCEDDDEDGAPVVEEEDEDETKQGEEQQHHGSGGGGGGEEENETSNNNNNNTNNNGSNGGPNNNNLNKGTHTSSLARMQATVVKWEAAVGEAKVVLRAATTAMANLEKEHVALLAKIPQLNQLKNEAAARRDFKAAGTASKEIKDAQARFNIVIEELTGDTAQRKSTAEEEFKVFEANLADAKAAAQAQEQIASQAKMTQLALKLAATLNMITQRKKEGGPTAANADTKTTDTHHRHRLSVNQVGIRVLENQLQALKLEGQALGEKFGGWNELLKEHLPQDVSAEENGTYEVVVGDAATAGSGRGNGNGNGNGEMEKSGTIQPIAGKPDRAATSTIMDTAEKVSKYRELMRQITEAETTLNEAVEAEDYERAADLQEVFDDLLRQVELLDLSEDEVALAEADDTVGESSMASPPPPPSPVPREESPTLVVANEDQDAPTTSVSEEPAAEEPITTDPIESMTEDPPDDSIADEPATEGTVGGDVTDDTLEPVENGMEVESADVPLNHSHDGSPEEENDNDDVVEIKHADTSDAESKSEKAMEKEEKQEHPAEEE